jgi:hypothetical protein
MRRFTTECLIIIFSGLILSFSSCVPAACFDQTVAFVKASFYNVTDKKLLPPDSLTMYGLGMDTNKIYNRNINIQPALIPLNSSADTCVIVIRIDKTNDTLKFRYTSYPHLISKECGYTYFHTIDTTVVSTHHLIHSIKVTSNLITNINGENIIIYY